jgi:uncharacterized NAD(P)/FAD-binding protein YdhS
VADQAKSVVIVGGGFSGCCLAVNLVRRSPRPLAITIIESRVRLGRGLAYSTSDPEHRLNAPSFVHSLIPDDAWHFTRWCLTQSLDASDHQAARPDGASYQRRSDFARYLEQTVQEHSHGAATGSSITHLKGTASSLRFLEEGTKSRYKISSREGQSLDADLVVCATGNHLPSLPSYLDASLAGHPSVIGNPFDSELYGALSLDAHVLVVGAGLTALDALSTLIKRGHRGVIEVVSRHGLRPVAQGPMPPALALAKTAEGLATLPGSLVIDRLMSPVPAFLADPAVPATVRAWLRALRSKIAEALAEGKTWHAPFDDLRDALWQLWPLLPTAEKRRFLRRLRPLYDIHRYRTPPQNDELVRAAEAQGIVRFRAARLVGVQSVEPRALEAEFVEQGSAVRTRHRYDALVNCSGLDKVAAMTANPLLDSLLKAKLIRADPCALGIDVDLHCCALSALGQTQPQLRFIGPPTLGAFGDPMGAIYIGAQIHRLIPDLLRLLADKAQAAT